MLSDFLLMESYFERSETAQFFEDLSKRYGEGSVAKAVAAGDLIRRRIICGPDCGRWLFWLSDQGRAKALN